MHFKSASAKWRPCCLGLNVLSWSLIWRQAITWISDDLVLWRHMASLVRRKIISMHETHHSKLCLIKKSHYKNTQTWNFYCFCLVTNNVKLQFDEAKMTWLKNVCSIKVHEESKSHISVRFLTVSIEGFGESGPRELKIFVFPHQYQHW